MSSALGERLTITKYISTPTTVRIQVRHVCIRLIGLQTRYQERISKINPSRMVAIRQATAQRLVSGGQLAKYGGYLPPRKGGRAAWKGGLRDSYLCIIDIEAWSQIERR